MDFNCEMKPGCPPPGPAISRLFRPGSLLLLLLPFALHAQSPTNFSSPIFETGDERSVCAPASEQNSYSPSALPIRHTADALGEDRFVPFAGAPLLADFARSADLDPESQIYEGSVLRLAASVTPDQQTSSSPAEHAVPNSKAEPSGNGVKSSALVAQRHQRPDRNLDIYYRNRTEFSLDVGYHSVNIPFIYDFAVGGGYNMTPLRYTLVPIVASLRWHVTNIGWRWIFRGNMDFTFSGSITAIPRGPETHYYSFDFGIRRNFVYRNWKVVPYFEQRGGAGLINAKEPLGVLWAQGQNLTFTYNMGAGARYNINDKYSFSAGMNYMHISNAYLSQPAFYNYGINVYGPMFGFDMRLGKPRHHGSE